MRRSGEYLCAEALQGSRAQVAWMPASGGTFAWRDARGAVLDPGDLYARVDGAVRRSLFAGEEGS